MSQIKKFEQIEKAKARKKEKEKARREAFEATRAAIKEQVKIEMQYFDLARAFFFLMCLVVVALSIYTGLQVFVK